MAARRALALGLVAMLLLSPAFATAPGSDAPERNRAWFRQVLGALDGAALDALVARAGQADLAQLTLGQPAGEATVLGAGNVWLIEVGSRDCPVATKLAEQPVFLFLDYRLIIYEGWLGHAESDVSVGGNGLAVDWLTSTFTPYADRQVTYAGNTDFFCYDAGRVTLHFPFIDGVAVGVAA